MLKNYLLTRLCGGWVPNDPSIAEAIDCLRDLNLKLILDSSGLEATKELYPGPIGSSFQIKGVNNNSVIWKTGESYPKISINWRMKTQSGEILIFDGSPEGLGEALKQLLN